MALLDLDALMYGQGAPNPATFKLEESKRPVEIDYSQGIPMPYLGRRPKDTEQWDDDLKKFREANPIPPDQLPNMAPQPPVAGLLGGNISAVPPGVGGNPAGPPALAPGAPAPPLPPPVTVAPPPGPAPGASPAPAMAAPAGGPPTDVSAQARPSALPAQEPKGILQRIDEMTQRNPSLLLQMAAGFAGAPSFATGMSRGFAGAAAGNQQDQANLLKTGGVRDTYKALVASGMPPQLALAASQNPAILAQVAPSYLADRKREIKTIKTKDAWGGETERLVSINPYDPTDVKEIGGKAGGSGGASDILQGGKSSGMFAQGITSDNFKHDAIGEDYLKQFSPEAQASIKGYLTGNTVQTGRQMPVQLIKMAAQKYGMDIGMPADDSAITQRKQWSNSLGDTKSGVGLQAKGFKQGLEHAMSLSDNLVKLGNVNGLGFEPAANWANWAKNMSTGNTSIKNAIQADSQTLAGEVGKLYSGGTGGGVHERERTAQNLGKTDQSPIAAAGGLEATIELMEGGLKTLENRRNELFPNGNAPKGSQFRDAQTDATLAHIRKNIAILKGEQAAAGGGATAPAGAIPWKVITP